MNTKTVNSFKYKIYKDRVVIEQRVVISTYELKTPSSNSIVKLSIILDDSDNVNELQRMYKLAKDIIRQYSCCFVLLSEISQTQLRYKLEII